MVRAVVTAQGPAERLMAAIAAQTRPPDEVERRPARATEVLATSAPWLWLLDGSALPAPDALERLVDAAEEQQSAPMLLAGTLLDAGGAIDRESLPLPRSIGPDATIAAFERRVLPVRAVRGGSLLVHRRGVEARGLPPAGDDGGALLWSAALLRDSAGLLVPRSRAVRLGPPGPRPMPWLGLLAGGALEAQEKPLLAFRLAERLLTASRSRVRLAALPAPPAQRPRARRA